MEVKKSEKASLKNKRFLFVEIGFVLALLITLGAFEYTTKEKKAATLTAENTEVAEEEIIPITQDTPPPPPEAPKIPIISDQIDIVDDDIAVEDNFMNIDDNADLGVEIRDYIEEVEEEVVEEEVIPKLAEHTWSEWTVTTPATHLQEGVKVRTCACGALETVTMPKLDGHVWGEWTVKKAATHLEEGEEERFCSCGERESRVLILCNLSASFIKSTLTSSHKPTITFLKYMAPSSLSLTISK